MVKKYTKFKLVNYLLEQYKKSHKWAKFIVIIALITLPFILFNIFQQWKLENRFKGLENDLNALTVSIKNRYPSANIKKNKYCTHEVVKFGGGKQYCLISLEVKEPIFGEKDHKQINQIIGSNTEFQQIIKMSENINEGILTSSSTSYKNNKILCNLDITNSKYGSLKYDLELRCSEFSKRSFYPYRD